MLTKFGDQLTSYIRTGVTLTLVVVFGWLSTGLHLNVPVADQETITAAFGVAASGLYYVVVRLLESKLSPSWGWLLGNPKAPTYPSNDQWDADALAAVQALAAGVSDAAAASFSPDLLAAVVTSARHASDLPGGDPGAGEPVSAVLPLSG